MQAIEYFAYYHSKNFFNGDIKPDNLLISNSLDKITSDAGSLLDLETDLAVDNPRFVVTSFTLGFASKEHIQAVVSRKPLTKH